MPFLGHLHSTIVLEILFELFHTFQVVRVIKQQQLAIGSLGNLVRMAMVVAFVMSEHPQALRNDSGSNHTDQDIIVAIWSTIHPIQ